LAAVVLAACFTVAAVAVNDVGAATRSRGALPGAARVASMLKGIPQQGLWLGRRDAKLTLVEYVDVQCPYCARFSHDIFPYLVEQYVRTGRVRVLFRGLAFVGPDSVTGLRWIVAAGRQNRLWNLLELMYANQGQENSGWVTAARLNAAARSVAGLNVKTLRRDAGSAAVTAQIRGAAAAAKAAGVPGTPYFQAGRSVVSLTPLQLKSWRPADFVSQLDGLLR
jgi:protein-disulfide isomerase